VGRGPRSRSVGVGGGIRRRSTEADDDEQVQVGDAVSRALGSSSSHEKGSHAAVEQNGADLGNRSAGSCGDLDRAEFGDGQVDHQPLQAGMHGHRDGIAAAGRRDRRGGGEPVGLDSSREMSAYGLPRGQRRSTVRRGERWASSGIGHAEDLLVRCTTDVTGSKESGQPPRWPPLAVMTCPVT